jgi:Na+-driven multidrug efflux pump
VRRGYDEKTLRQLLQPHFKVQKVVNYMGRLAFVAMLISDATVSPSLKKYPYVLALTFPVGLLLLWLDTLLNGLGRHRQIMIIAKKVQP